MLLFVKAKGLQSFKDYTECLKSYRHSYQILLPAQGFMMNEQMNSL